ncbi:TTI1 family protein [Megaselia abdita]
MERLQTLDKEIENSTGHRKQLLIFPLIMKLEHLNSEGGNNQEKVKLLICISNILSSHNIKNIKEFKVILYVALKELKGVTENINGICEEIIDAILDIIIFSLRNCHNNVLEELYCESSIEILSNLCLACVRIIENQKHRKLKTKSIQCLKLLYYVDSTSDFEDKIIRNQSANCLYLFIPKIMKLLLQIAVGDDIHGIDLKLISLEAFYKIICIIFEDYNKSSSTEGQHFKDFFDILSSENIETKSDDNILNIRKNMKSFDNRSTEWLNAAAHKINPLLKLTLPLVVNPNKLIRNEMFNMSELLIRNCLSNMQYNMEVLLECLIILSQDEEEELSNKALNFLICFNKKQGFNSNYRKFYEHLLVKKLSAMNRITNKGFSVEQQFVFKLLKGSFNILHLNMSIKSLVLQPGILDKFVYGMIHAFELKITKNLLDKNKERDEHFNWKQFRYIDDVEHCNILFDTLKICGRCEAAHIIFDRLMEIKTTSDFRTEIYMIATILVCESESLELHELFLSHLLVPENFNLTVEFELNQTIEKMEGSQFYKRAQINYRDIEYNILHICVINDAIGNLSSRMAMNFMSHIFDCIHVIILNGASDFFVIKETALETLTSISRSIGLNSMESLLSNYTDYICFHININLQHSTQFSDGLKILNFVLEHTTTNSSNQLLSIFYSILNNWERVYSVRNIKPMLKVFDIFFQKVLRKEFKNFDTDNYSQNLDESQEPDYYKNNILTLSTDILNSILKVLSSNDIYNQILCLDCLISGLPCLQSEDSRLRICHLIWNPLVEKFKAKCPVVLYKCFELLILLSKLAKDFLRQRTVSNILPILNDFLITTYNRTKCVTITA